LVRSGPLRYASVLRFRIAHIIAFGTTRSLALPSDRHHMQTLINVTDEITESIPSLVVSECPRGNAPSKIRSTKAKPRIAVYAGVTLLAAITGFVLLYNYAVSVLDSALSFFEP
jgi:hypothetical protein